MAEPSAPTKARRITRTSLAALVAAALVAVVVRLVAGPVPLLAAHRLKRRFACNLLTEPSRQGPGSFARQ